MTYHLLGVICRDSSPNVSTHNGPISDFFIRSITEHMANLTAVCAYDRSRERSNAINLWRSIVECVKNKRGNRKKGEGLFM